MKDEYIREILENLDAGKITAGEAFERLKDLPYRDLGFANVDHHRAMRTGFPEVIYCQGKKPEQIRDIFMELMDRGQPVMATRADDADFRAVSERIPEAIYHEEARIIEVPGEGNRVPGSGEDDPVGDAPTGNGDPSGYAPSGKGDPSGDAPTGNGDPSTGKGDRCRKRIAVVSAGTADIPVAEEAAVTAEILGNEVIRIYDVGVAGIHRLFDRLDDIRSADVVIAVAGMEGALASVLGGLVDSPVIAVPTSVGYGANLEGLSALLSMLNSCANGVSVVNIDNGFGAGYTASIITRRMSRDVKKTSHYVSREERMP